jgi:hypothetical protein
MNRLKKPGVKNALVAIATGFATSLAIPCIDNLSKMKEEAGEND